MNGDDLKDVRVEDKAFYLFAEPCRFNTDGKNIELALLIHPFVVSGPGRSEGQSRFTASTGICRKSPGGLENGCSP